MVKWLPLTDIRLVRTRTGAIRPSSPDCTPRAIEVHDCTDCPYNHDGHCIVDDYRKIDADEWYQFCPLYQRGPVITVLNDGADE